MTNVGLPSTCPALGEVRTCQLPSCFTWQVGPGWQGTSYRVAQVTEVGQCNLEEEGAACGVGHRQQVHLTPYILHLTP